MPRRITCLKCRGELISNKHKIVHKENNRLACPKKEQRSR